MGKPLFAALRGIILVAFQTVPLMCAWAQAITPSDVKSVISTEEFYTKNKLTLVIDSAPGGGYDTYGRLLARFYGANIPGRPAVVVQNMPGAGGLTAVNWLAQVAPRDGSAIQIMSRSIPLAPLMGTPGARFEPLDLSWIGSMNRENIIAFSCARAQKKKKAEKRADTQRKRGVLIKNTVFSIVYILYNV